MTPPARKAGDHDARARMAKARQFSDAAALLFDRATATAAYPDAYVTHAVHAGIAAADVICIRRLGSYSATGAHDEAIRLLESADKASANHLKRLLALKTKAGYSTSPVSAADVAVAHRTHVALIEAALAEILEGYRTGTTTGRPFTTCRSTGSPYTRCTRSAVSTSAGAPNASSRPLATRASRSA